MYKLLETGSGTRITISLTAETPVLIPDETGLGGSDRKVSTPSDESDEGVRGRIKIGSNLTLEGLPFLTKV